MDPIELEGPPIPTRPPPTRWRMRLLTFAVLAAVAGLGAWVWQTNATPSNPKPPVLVWRDTAGHETPVAPPEQDPTETAHIVAGCREQCVTWRAPGKGDDPFWRLYIGPAADFAAVPEPKEQVSP
jgi:hypothetical protein